MPEKHEKGRPVAEEGYFKTLFDSAPFPVLIVDEDARIVNHNPAAVHLAGPNRAQQYLHPCGKAFHCVHAELAPEGCGHAEACRDCVVRNTVRDAFLESRTLRRKAVLSLRKGSAGEVEKLDFSVTAAPFAYEGKPLILLILEDITELVALRRILPICSHCGKVRNDDGYWESVEEYLRNHPDLMLSHSICNRCMEKHYKDYPQGSRKA